MKIGIPKGLLYYKYFMFIKTFLEELNIEVVTSKDTDRYILDLGVKSAVDDACLPIKVFHGHIEYLKDMCDIILLPRLMSTAKGQYICPKFCGLPEMITSSISNLPKVLVEPIYGLDKKSTYDFSCRIGKKLGATRKNIDRAFMRAIDEQRRFMTTKLIVKGSYNVALIGHPYNIYDSYINMNIVNKLKVANIGVLTEEYVSKENIEDEVKQLFKKPFWHFAKNSYGFAAYISKNKLVDGIIYISSFACGIDSVIIELIKNRVKNMPILILKIDEQTGEAGFNTRIEAFTDMLERRCI